AAFLVLGIIASNFCTPMGVYLRAHKREPYMALSVIIGLLTGLVAWILSKQQVGAGVIAAGYMAVAVLVSLPMGLLIFYRCRKEWHHEHPSMTAILAGASKGGDETHRDWVVGGAAKGPS